MISCSYLHLNFLQEKLKSNWSISVSIIKKLHTQYIL
jgi:hypothetical protein